MISWSLTLTGGHIQILRALREHGTSAVSHTDSKSWTTSSRLLVREGLIEFKGKHEPHREGYTGPHLTKRGDFILSAVEADIARYLTVKRGKVTLTLAKKRA